MEQTVREFLSLSDEVELALFVKYKAPELCHLCVD